MGKIKMMKELDIESSEREIAEKMLKVENNRKKIIKDQKKNV
jgi:hypothetical protein